MAKNHLKLMCLGSLTVGRPLGGSFHSPTHQSATFPSEATWPPPPTGLGSHHAPPDRLIIGCWPRDLSGFFGVCCVLHVGAGSWPYLMRDEAFFMQILYVVSQKKNCAKQKANQIMLTWQLHPWSQILALLSGLVGLCRDLMEPPPQGGQIRVVAICHNLSGFIGICRDAPLEVLGSHVGKIGRRGEEKCPHLIWCAGAEPLHNFGQIPRLGY